MYVYSCVKKNINDLGKKYSYQLSIFWLVKNIFCVITIGKDIRWTTPCIASGKCRVDAMTVGS